MYARNTTNIEMALSRANEIIEKYAVPELSQSHIFMTDGEITAGSGRSIYNGVHKIIRFFGFNGM